MREALESFLTIGLDTLFERHLQLSPMSRALELFREVASSVPAYRAFLEEQGIDPPAVQTAEDFERLPLLTKQNYIGRYPLKDLCRHGRLESCDMIAVSSGSTGEPTFWPRFVTDEFPIATRFEQVFHDSFNADRRRTLAVVCFALGTWVGACTRQAAAATSPPRAIPSP